MDITTDTQVVKTIPTSASKLTLDEAVRANLETGILLLCKEALVTAIQDRRLHRGHLKVLAAIATFMNSTTAKAWPGRSSIAALLAMPVKTVSNLLLELRGFGYLLAARQAVEEANNRKLTVYTWGNIDHETIRREITKFVEGMRNGTVPSQRDHESPAPAGQSRPSGTSEVPSQRDSPVPAGTSTEKVPPGRVQKSRQDGDSNSIKEKEDIYIECSQCNSNEPHICSGVFVISKQHGLIVPAKAVEVWRKRFSAIPDLEAHMAMLSTYIRKKGIMHVGWDQPAAWMAGQLARDNERAIRENRVASARVARTTATDPSRNSWASAKR